MRLSLSKCVSQARVSSSRTPASKEDISSSRLAHSRPYHRQRLRPPRIIDSTLLKPTESVSLTRLLSPFVQHVQAIQRRTFIRPPLDSRELGSVNLLEIKKFLRQKSIEFTESHACIAIQIPKHLVSGDTAPINWKALDTAFSVFYINKTTGDYVCPELAVCDDWNALREFLSAWCRNRNLKKTDPREELPHLSQLLPPSNTDSGQELWQLAEPVEALDALEFRALLKTFRLPVKELKPEDFARFEARVKKVYLTDGDDEDQKKVVYELLFPVRYINGVIVGIRRIFKCPEKGTIVEESVTSQTPLLTSAPNQCRVLPFPHGLDAAYRAHASSVVLVSSVLDSLVLSVKSPDGAIFPVALAEGALTLPPEHLPFFEQFDGGITFWFPDNVTAYDSVRTFARKLGEKRCNVVTRDVPQPHMWIRQKQETDILMVVRKLIRPCSHEYITTFESMRDDVFLEIAHHEEIRGVRWKRFDQLNDLLGGFRRGELTVFSGRTGSGKTTFMSEYSLDLCAQNVTTLWGSFEVKNTRLAKMQLRQLAAVNFEDHLDQFDKWADRFQKLPMYYLTFHGAQEVTIIAYQSIRI
jgi:twinkle protein